MLKTIQREKKVLSKRLFQGKNAILNEKRPQIQTQIDKNT